LQQAIFQIEIMSTSIKCRPKRLSVVSAEGQDGPRFRVAGICHIAIDGA